MKAKQNDSFGWTHRRVDGAALADSASHDPRIDAELRFRTRRAVDQMLGAWLLATICVVMACIAVFARAVQ